MIGSALLQAPSLLLHAGAAVAMLVLLPRGFPLLHPHFFANTLVPCVLLSVTLGTAVALRVRPRAATSWLAAYPAAWLGVALSAALSFPVSGGTVARFVGAGALFLGLSWLVWARCFPPRSRPLLLTLGVACALGAALPLAERAPAATTRPSVTPPMAPLVGSDLSRGDATVNLTPHLGVTPESGEVEVNWGEVRLEVRPFLEFESRSPDGFWTLFSPQISVQRELLRAVRNDSWLDLSYGPTQSLRVEARSNGAVHIDATTVVPREVYSHLNSFTTVLLTGHRRLGLRFSACPGSTLEITHADYPVGAPASFAYLDEHEVFHLVRATSAEKGPYTSLASGRLPRGASLDITFVELAETPARVLGELHFEDWTRELSTALSPTAGFGVAENAIEFGLASTNSASRAYLVLNLAGTSVGRGWDSVGHRPGPYRNRLTLKRADAAP